MSSDQTDPATQDLKRDLNPDLKRGHEKVKDFAVFLKDAGRQPATVDSYTRDARSFVAYLHSIGLSISRVESQTLVHFEEYLRHDKHERENSVRRSVIGVRLFYRYLVESGAVKSTPFDEVPIPQRQEELPSALKNLDWKSLIQAASADGTPLRSARNTVIVCLLALEGVKATELIELEWKDLINFESGATLQIHGQRKRALVLGEESYKALIGYRSLLADAIGARAGDADSMNETRIAVAFQGRDGSTILPKMTRHGLKFVIYEIGEKIGLPHLNSEVLRHYAVTHLLSEGKSVEEIKVHLGLRRVGNISKHLSSAVSTTESEGTTH